MFDFRYHVASLVAVVVMLGVGMLVGSAIGDRGVMDKQMVGLVQSLQKDFTALKQNNDQLKTDLARDRSFAAASAGALTAGQLNGRTIVVVVNDGRTDGLSAVTAEIQKAGGRVVVARFPEAGLGLASDAALAGKIKATVDGSATAGDPAVLAARVLADEWTNSGFDLGPVSDALTASGKLHLEDASRGQKPDAVVLLATWDGKADPALVELTSHLAAAGLPAVGAETRLRQAGVADAASAAGLSTVDDVDTASGGYSLVELLTGRVKGRYGTGPGAEATFPDIPLGR